MKFMFTDEQNILQIQLYYDGAIIQQYLFYIVQASFVERNCI